LLACETLLPDIGRFPVTWQTRAMATPFIWLLVNDLGLAKRLMANTNY